MYDVSGKLLNGVKSTCASSLSYVGVKQVRASVSGLIVV